MERQQAADGAAVRPSREGLPTSLRGVWALRASCTALSVQRPESRQRPKDKGLQMTMHSDASRPSPAGKRTKLQIGTTPRRALWATGLRLFCLKGRRDDRA